MATEAAFNLLVIEGDPPAISEGPLAEQWGSKPSPVEMLVKGSDAAELQGQLEALIREARSAKDAAQALGKARALIGDNQGDPSVRLAILVLREKAGETAGLLQDIESLMQDLPDDRILLELYLRSLLKDQQRDRALSALEAVLPASSTDVQVQLALAELLDRIKLFVESDAAYARALTLRDQPSVRINWAKRLAKRFLFEDAGRLVEGLSKGLSGDKGKALLTEIEAERAFFSRFRPVGGLVGRDFRIVAMEQAVLQFRHREVRQPRQDALKLSLVTGNLGPGGAERQLCVLARLVKAQIAQSPDKGNAHFSEVEVIVKEHAREGVSDFFLGDLQEAGVPVCQINEMKPVKANNQVSLGPDLAHLLNMLPSQVHYGVARLSPHYRATQPDVVSLWQDGACLFGALAALFAGVPRIQLVFRGLPPNIRTNRFKPEYELLYRALARIPGIEFVCNSRSGATAYAEWLDLPVERITVLYNGVEFSNETPTETECEKWERFVASTADATETIGGVFRFESDKRPLSWIRIAAAYLRERPKARFVIVGDGRLLPAAEEKAKILGISERLLFAGNSRAVRFWYDRMDVKLLSSRFEGLPNVLIEAQSRGCPVVSTPAGGAAECFAPGLTGHLLDCAENPDIELACERIRHLVDLRQSEKDRMSEETRNFVRRFAVEEVIENFTTICNRPLQSAVLT